MIRRRKKEELGNEAPMVIWPKDVVRMFKHLREIARRRPKRAK